MKIQMNETFTREEITDRLYKLGYSKSDIDKILEGVINNREKVDISKSGENKELSSLDYQKLGYDPTLIATRFNELNKFVIGIS